METLVVLVILALTLAVARLALERWQPKLAARAAVLEAVRTLEAARAKAVAEGSPVDVAVNPKGLLVSGQAGMTWPSGLSGSFAPEEMFGQTEAIRFFPDGSAWGGVLTVSGETARRTIRIEWLTGTVSTVVGGEAG